MQATRRRMLASLAGAALCLSYVPVTAAAELKVFAGFGMKTALDDLGPQFERSAGHKLSVVYSASAAMKKQIEAGEVFDVAIVTNAIIDDPVFRSRVGAPVVLARAGVAIAAKAGASKPAVDSAESLKRALLSAKSVAFTVDGAASAHFQRVAQQLGIAEDLKAKALLEKSGERAIQAVADGKAELGLSTVPIIYGNPGVQLVATFPRELQDYVVYSAGVATSTKNADGARALVNFLADERTAATWRAKGLEPGVPR